MTQTEQEAILRLTAEVAANRATVERVLAQMAEQTRDRHARDQLLFARLTAVEQRLTLARGFGMGVAAMWTFIGGVIGANWHVLVDWIKRVI